MTARDALAAIRERAEAATEGPWEAADYLVMASDIDITDCQIRPDAEFIAHARTDVPALVEALEAVLAIPEPTPDPTATPGGREDAWVSGYNAALHAMRAKVETALEPR